VCRFITLTEVRSDTTRKVAVPVENIAKIAALDRRALDGAKSEVFFRAPLVDHNNAAFRTMLIAEDVETAVSLVS
jgi:hypothetical protein